ncbi:MAG TPA: zinc dependent phospholipase C family protein [Syntrophomonadaceae bacterium]|nr:zinc dependent phospholipase C family protein [Syntrophomonadaceae bacterium]
MPKEMTHWTIAKKIFDSMDDSFIKSCIDHYQELFFIGAVAFDTPYYVTGRYHPLFQSIAQYLHGVHGENTFEPLVRAFKQYPESISEATMALLCGMLTHIMIDGEFHPLVYYLTGDYHHPNPAMRNRAMSSHRKLEAELDLYYTRNFELFQPGFLSHCLQHKRISDEELYPLLSLIYFDATQPYQNQIMQAIQTQARMLQRFTSRRLFHFYRVANFMSQGRLYPTLALFYPPIDQNTGERFRGEIEYVHPCDLEKRRERIEEIEKRAISRSLLILEQWAQASSGRDLVQWSDQMAGPSLETGL